MPMSQADEQRPWEEVTVSAPLATLGPSGASIVDVGVHHGILPLCGGMTGQSAPAVLACWLL